MKENFLNFCSKHKKVLNLTYIFVISFCVLLTFVADRAFYVTSFSSLVFSFLGNRFLSVPLFCFIFLSFKKYDSFFKRSNRNLNVCVFLSICFSFFQVVGYSIDRYTQLFYPWFNIYLLIFDVILLVGHFFIFYFFTNFAFYALDKLSTRALRSQEKWAFFSYNNKSVFVSAGILVLCWSVYYVVLFPGVVTWDSYYQIEQGLLFRPLTDEHPFLHSLMQGAIINLGSKIFGSINLGISLFSAFQLIVIAFIVSYSLKIMAKYQIPLCVRIFCLAFYSLYPTVGAYSVTLWKDVWIAAFLLLYASLLADLFLDIENFFKSGLKVFILVLTIFAVMMSKGTGIIFIIFSMIPFGFKMYRKYLLKSTILYLIPFTLFFLIRAFLIPYLGIQKGHIREPMSVPVQQIARVVKEHGDSLNNYDRGQINEILPYENLPDLYDARLSDNIKNELNEQVFVSNPSKYIKLWARLGLHYPKTYLESFLCNSYGYWYPETKYWAMSSCSYIKMINWYKESNWTIYDENLETYPENDFEFRTSFRRFINTCLREIPIVSFFCSIAFYFWVELFCACYCLKRKTNPISVLFFIAFAVFLTCVMSPVHAETRYAYPAILLFPFISAFSFFKVKVCDNFGKSPKKR